MSINHYLDWASEFASSVFGSLWQIVKGFYNGLKTIILSLYYGVVGTYDVPAYLRMTKNYAKTFTEIEKVLAILTFVLIYAVLIAVTVLLILAIRDLVYIAKGKKIPRRPRRHHHKHKRHKSRKNKNKKK